MIVWPILANTTLVHFYCIFFFNQSLPLDDVIIVVFFHIINKILLSYSHIQVKLFFFFFKLLNFHYQLLKCHNEIYSPPPSVIFPSLRP